MNSVESGRPRSASRPRIAVIGAGAFGGWTALHLVRAGAEVVLVDAWGAGNPRSSSGGETRVIRAIYGPDPVYVALVRRAWPQWEALAAGTGERLYVETGALWMNRGDDSYVRASLPIVQDSGFSVEQLTESEGSRRYPQIDFGDVESIFFEHKAGALFARLACRTVIDEFERAGGQFRIGYVEDLSRLDAPLISLALSDGTRIEADAFVFACGPWLGRIFPDVIGDAVRPTRQEVFYFGAPAGSSLYTPDRCPVWIEFGERIFYGIPDVNGQGFKVADDTRGEDFDPTSGDRATGADGIGRARSLLQRRFPALAGAPLLKTEVCQYENSPDGHLIIDRHPGAANVWLVGGGSGHGFKLSPAVGELVSDAILTASHPPEVFHVARLRNATGTSTQFERRPAAPPQPR